MAELKVYQAITKITDALSKIGIAKERRGQNYNFRGIDDVYNHLATLLAEHKLCIIPVLLERECVERQAKSGSALFYATVKARFDIVSAEDGSKHEAVTYGEAMDSSDKATNKAMSTAYKYMAFMTFCIPTEGDNDTENQTIEVAPQKNPLEEDAVLLAASIDAAKTVEELDDIVHEHASFTGSLKEKAPKWHKAMLAKIDAKRFSFAKGRAN